MPQFDDFRGFENGPVLLLLATGWRTLIETVNQSGSLPMSTDSFDSHQRVSLEKEDSRARYKGGWV
jgi:hypothetical protein